MTTELPLTISIGTGTASDQEIDRFARIANAWWDPDGAFRALHRLNPLRAAYVRDQLCRHFGREIGADRPSPAFASSTSVAAVAC